jgi:hypothetical protein
MCLSTSRVPLCNWAPWGQRMELVKFNKTKRNQHVMALYPKIDLCNKFDSACVRHLTILSFGCTPGILRGLKLVRGGLDRASIPACPSSPAADRPKPARNAGTSTTGMCTPARSRSAAASRMMKTHGNGIAVSIPGHIRANTRAAPLRRYQAGLAVPNVRQT